MGWPVSSARVPLALATAFTASSSLTCHGSCCLVIPFSTLLPTDAKKCCRFLAEKHSCMFTFPILRNGLIRQQREGAAGVGDFFHCVFVVDVPRHFLLCDPFLEAVPHISDKWRKNIYVWWDHSTRSCVRFPEPPVGIRQNFGLRGEVLDQLNLLPSNCLPLHDSKFSHLYVSPARVIVTENELQWRLWPVHFFYCSGFSNKNWKILVSKSMFWFLCQNAEFVLLTQLNGIWSVVTNL